MSRLGAMRSLAGQAGSALQGATGRAGSAIQGAANRAGTAIQGSAAYQGVAETAGQSINMEINWGTIGIILLLGFFYMVIASLGIDTFSKCDELKGKTVQENLNKWLIATLAIALTVPFTLLVTKMAGTKKLGAFTFLYAIMGLIGSAATLNWARNCAEAKKDQSKLVYSGVNVASFSCVLLISMFLIAR
jgi:4-amino-4-deoxy-L-arabinose transferase-like glycosyltransferase